MLARKEIVMERGHANPKVETRHVRDLESPHAREFLETEVVGGGKQCCRRLGLSVPSSELNYGSPKGFVLYHSFLIDILSSISTSCDLSYLAEGSVRISRYVPRHLPYQSTFRGSKQLYFLTWSSCAGWTCRPSERQR